MSDPQDSFFQAAAPYVSDPEDGLLRGPYLHPRYSITKNPALIYIIYGKKS